MRKINDLQKAVEFIQTLEISPLKVEWSVLDDGRPSVTILLQSVCSAHLSRLSSKIHYSIFCNPMSESSFGSDSIKLLLW